MSNFLHAYLLVIRSGVSIEQVAWNEAEQMRYPSMVRKEQRTFLGLMHEPKQDQSAWKPRGSRETQAACLPPG